MRKCVDELVGYICSVFKIDLDQRNEIDEIQ